MIKGQKIHLDGANIWHQVISGIQVADDVAKANLGNVTINKKDDGSISVDYDGKELVNEHTRSVGFEWFSSFGSFVRVTDRFSNGIVMTTIIEIPPNTSEAEESDNAEFSYVISEIEGGTIDLNELIELKDEDFASVEIHSAGEGEKIKVRKKKKDKDKKSKRSYS